MTAQKILEEAVSNWGERESYLITEEEFRVFLGEGVIIEKFNKPNGDGTFCSSLIFKGKQFLCVLDIEIGGVN